MKKFFSIICVSFIIMMMVACGSNESVESPSDEFTEKTTKIEENIISEKEEEVDMAKKMYVTIGDYCFTATLESNEAVNELVEMMKGAPVLLTLDDYSGFEKVGPLGRKLTRSDKQTTTRSGDIVLYNGSNIVIFYGSNSWSYTRLGKIDDLTNWEKALGIGSVTVKLSLEN